MANEKAQAKQERAVAIAVEKTAKAIEGQLNKALRTQAKLVNQNSKAWKAGQSVIARAMKGNERLSASYAKTAKALVKLQKAMQGSMAGKSAGTSRSTGGGIGIPAFLSAAAITAAATAMGRYMTQLARVRDVARAMAGSFRSVELPFARDAELFADFANQNFANRFAGSSAIGGLRALRDALAKSLGPEAGKQITLGVTKGFGANTEALDEFLAKVRVDVPAALKQFQNVGDINAMTTALHSVQMQQTELSKTSFSLEKAIQEVRDSFELLVRDFVEKNGVDLQNIFQNVSQSIVEGINWVRQFAVDAGHAFSYVKGAWQVMTDVMRLPGDVIDFFQKDLPILLGYDTNQAVVQALDSQIDQALKSGNNDLAKRLKSARDAASKGLNASVTTDRVIDRYTPPPQAERITLQFAKANEQAARDMQSAADAAKRERAEIEQLLTPAERVAIVLQRLGREAEFLAGGLAVSLAKLSYLESSPLGFGATFGVRLEAIQKINQQLELARKRLESLNSLERQSDDQRKEALSLEEQIYKMMQQRMDLQKELNKGYLDAVVGENFGIGSRFEKILVTADQNLAKSLELRMVKANRMLGQVGAAARASDVQPFRFGTDMEKTLQDAHKYGEELSKNWMSKGERKIFEQLMSIDEKLTIGKPSPATDDQIREEMERGPKRKRIVKPNPNTTDAQSLLIQAARLMLRGAENMEPQSFGPDGSVFPSGSSFV